MPRKLTDRPNSKRRIEINLRLPAAIEAQFRKLVALRQLQGATADEVSRQALIIAALEAYLPTVAAETTRLQRELSRSAPDLLKALLARLDGE